MQYRIKRAGREFVVYAGDSQILRCATRKEARQVVRSVQDPSEAEHWFRMRKRNAIDLGWLFGGILIVAMVLLYVYR
jgi:hypothetical protein